MRLSRLSAIGVIFGLGVIVLSACGANNETVGRLLPDFVRNAPPAVREAYDYAVAHPDELAKYPCYCGCNAMGHTSNLSCYLKEAPIGGEVKYDNHAVGCGICVDITRDVMRLKGEGKSSREVRAYIDATYSAFGPSTNTPLPVD